MEGNELVVSDDPTTVQARWVARLGNECEELPAESAQQWDNLSQQLFPACSGVWIDNFHDGSLRQLVVQPMAWSHKRLPSLRYE